MFAGDWCHELCRQSVAAPLRRAQSLAQQLKLGQQKLKALKLSPKAGVNGFRTGLDRTDITANPVNQIVPERDVLQYVFSVPYPLRFTMTFYPKVTQTELDIWPNGLRAPLRQ